MKWNLARRAGVVAALLTVLASIWPSHPLGAGVYERRLNRLEAIYGYTELREDSVDFGTMFESVSRVEVRISGFHTNGWFEAFYLSGPLGASIRMGVENLPWANHRTAGGIDLNTNGPVAVTVPVPPQTIVPDWSQLLDGQAVIYVRNDGHGFAGGGSVVEAPYLQITELVLRVDAVPVLKLAYDGATGQLSWSSLPSDGRLRVYSAPNPDGVWELLGEYDAGSPFPQWPVGNNGRRFFKATWVKNQ